MAFDPGCVPLLPHMSGTGAVDILPHKSNTCSHHESVYATVGCINGTCLATQHCPHSRSFTTALKCVQYKPWHQFPWEHRCLGCTETFISSHKQTSTRRQLGEREGDTWHRADNQLILPVLRTRLFTVLFQSDIFVCFSKSQSCFKEKWLNIQVKNNPKMKQNIGIKENNSVVPILFHFPGQKKKKNQRLFCLAWSLFLYFMTSDLASHTTYLNFPHLSPNMLERGRMCLFIASNCSALNCPCDR